MAVLPGRFFCAGGSGHSFSVEGLYKSPFFVYNTFLEYYAAAAERMALWAEENRIAIRSVD